MRVVDCLCDCCNAVEVFLFVSLCMLFVLRVAGGVWTNKKQSTLTQTQIAYITRVTLLFDVLCCLSFVCLCCVVAVRVFVVSVCFVIVMLLLLLWMVLLLGQTNDKQKPNIDIPKTHLSCMSLLFVFCFVCLQIMFVCVVCSMCCWLLLFLLWLL